MEKKDDYDELTPLLSQYSDDDIDSFDSDENDGLPNDNPLSVNNGPKSVLPKSFAINNGPNNEIPYSFSSNNGPKDEISYSFSNNNRPKDDLSYSFSNNNGPK